MPRLTPEELDDFLNTYPVAHIATLTADGSPYVVPMAFCFTGSAILTAARGRSVWYLNLARDPRCSLSIDEPFRPLRRVNVTGVRAEQLYPPGHEKAWIDIKRKIEIQGMTARLKAKHGELTDELRELAIQRAEDYLKAVSEIPYALFSIPFEYPSPTVTTARPVRGKDGDLTGAFPAKYGEIVKPT